ncbi:fumarate reductase subunit FrdC [Erwinia tracheiphila]|uniref:Fumarate reductase subunit C n=1 Tax=Erwinia tracheiphila TaxID=65700 RepID=A0A0M2KBG6_9GAMM|nr:fumarate reductase subunit FrdC [Erwinia tracheiphila]AXF77416.1 fumarate reductase subunit FrdC [Erwinia tracheiphila]EOS95169.1 fumarate reductase, cytochrome b subunit [Erwinia tracheiphila PSU-1]KKF36289.1 fumarate reductase [Erwinia tracheiphila]UIA83892.1 fumarate reductase subunit FrdC [Erwinia tracheiphila]UIA87614.1 fumarate reductase subunit FrdC [Erwinia tracheiphila]
MATKRNAYHPPMTANWWQKSKFYRFYMLREGTAIPALWFSLELIGGLFALKHSAESWQEFVTFLQHPVILLLNIITLAAALLHSKTWFELAPKASVIIIGDKKLSPQPVIKALWLVTIVVSMTVLVATFLPETL